MRASSFVLLVLGALLSLSALSLVSAEAPLAPGEKPIGPQYITGNIVWALLVGLMLLFILYIGTGCIMSVERPVRLSAVPLQVGKEY